MSRAIISARRRAEASALVRGTVASRLSWRPWPCVILAIDPGARGGWGILRAGDRCCSGTATSARERRNVIGIARDIERADTGIAMGEPLPLAIAAEKWTAGGWKSVDQIAGTGAAWGRWAEQLELAGVPDSWIVRVTSQTWRAPTVGRVKGGSAAYKAAAMLRARAVHKLRLIEPDEAEALCIGEWASRAPEVLEVLPKKLRDELAPGGGR